MGDVGQQLYAPPGWINSTTPSFASTACGAYLQTQTFSVVGSVAVQIAFPQPLSWSQGTAWTPDASGIVFTCQTPGIYSVVINQTLAQTTER